MNRLLTNVELKAEVLSYGVRISKNALNNFSLPYLIKRRAYGNPDEESITKREIPQEFIFQPDNIIANIIIKETSPWTIEYDGVYYLYNEITKCKYNITFTETPSFYGMKTNEGEDIESILTFIFGHSLGVFVNSSCYFSLKGKQCHYCSIDSNQARPNNIKKILERNSTLEALKTAIVNDDKGLINSIFISGGVFEVNDSNWLYYAELAIEAEKLIKKLNKNIVVTLNVFSPKDEQIIDILRYSDINILVSTEIFDKELFKKICPGKSEQLTKKHLCKVLDKYVSVLGQNNRVFSIVIQGLEEMASLRDGIISYAERGVCTIVNVLHLDTGTELLLKGVTVPSPQQVLEIAKYTSDIYNRYGFNSSIAYGGRSSFDREASIGLI